MKAQPLIKVRGVILGPSATEVLLELRSASPPCKSNCFPVRETVLVWEIKFVDSRSKVPWLGGMISGWMDGWVNGRMGE